MGTENKIVPGTELNIAAFAGERRNMNSKRSALDTLAQEAILMTEEQLLTETQKVRSNVNGSTPALAKGQMANNNGTSPSLTAVKSKPGSGPTQVGKARSLPAAFDRTDIARDQQTGIANAPDQRGMDTPAVSLKPTDIPRERGGLDSSFLVVPLAIAGGIDGVILAGVVVGGASFIGGAIGGAIVGAAIGWIISAFLWRIGVHEDEADCSWCGQELDPTLYVCPSCATPVKYQWGKAPLNLTPSDHVFLDMVPRKNKEDNGRSWVEAEVPYGGFANRLYQVLATAILANEAAGAIGLEMAKGKLVAITAGDDCQLPGGCLEADLCRAGLVYDTVFDWIERTSSSPEGDAVKRIMKSMANRTLLEQERKRVLNLFTMISSRYVLPKRTSDSLMERSVRLIEECKRARPEVHDHLTKDIARAFAERTEEPSDGD